MLVDALDGPWFDLYACERQVLTLIRRESASVLAEQDDIVGE